jgi:hypothetical protein
MKTMKKTTALVLFACLTALSLRADVLYLDSSNYPYANGFIEGQGGWYAYLSPTAGGTNTYVTNNVLLLASTSANDSVATPTNGFVNPSQVTYASFTINVSKLPGTQNGGYFCQFQDTNNASDCHLFIDTRGTVVPGTYRLGIANYATSFSALIPPNNFPLDLATGVTYNVVILFDNNQGDSLVGATLWVNPSLNDYNNAVDFPTSPNGFVYGTDTGTAAQNNITNSLIGFSPYIDAGISNVTIATTFSEANITNLPAFGIQPQSGTNYSGNSTAFYAVASGVDVTYQWFSLAYGALVDDGVNIIGSTSNVLVLNNLTNTDSYYAIATDTYGNTVYSTTNTETVNTTLTAPFFPPSTPGQPSTGGLHLTNNLFTSSGFTNVAQGSGPLIYQWYFAPANQTATNTIINFTTSFTPLAGQTNSGLSLTLGDYSYQGSYFVVASNTVAGGSLTYGPTNTLAESAPLVATLAQLHNLLLASSSQLVTYKSGYYYINSNNITVGGYVSTYGGSWAGLGSSGYTEFFIQDGGYGAEVFLNSFGNTNQPPLGTYITVTGPLEVYHDGLEIVPATLASFTTNSAAPVQVLAPKLSNANFNDLSTNGFGTNALNTSCSLVTFTNVYIYKDKLGGAYVANYGNFYTNSSTTLYFTIGQYHYPDNTNWIESFQFGYNHGPVISQFTHQLVPTNCYQITGAYLNYGGTPEILPSRIQDYVTNAPGPISPGIALSNSAPSITWPVQAGSTYSVNIATNLLGPWTPVSGLGYYPTNGAYTDTNKASAKFYRVSSP